MDTVYIMIHSSAITTDHTAIGYWLAFDGITLHMFVVNLRKNKLRISILVAILTPPMTACRFRGVVRSAVMDMIVRLISEG